MGRAIPLPPSMPAWHVMGQPLPSLSIPLCKGFQLFMVNWDQTKSDLKGVPQLESNFQS